MKHVDKGWGYERWIHNSSLYCGKLLYFYARKRCSLHYHKLKHETFYVGSGKILLRWGTNENDLQEKIMMKGDIHEVPPMQVHQMIALEDTELYEFSTQHFDEDSYRLVKGD